MTLTDRPPVSDQHTMGPPAPELGTNALIEEARRRARHRHLAVVLAAVLLASAAGSIGFMIAGGGAVASPPLATSAFARFVAAHTQAAGSADIAFRSGPRRQGGCIPASNAPIDTGTGTIDFAHQRLAASITTSGCQQRSSTTSVRAFGDTTFEHLPPPYQPGSPITISRPWVAGPFNSVGYASLEGLATSTTLLHVLRALSGPVTRDGTATIDGMRTNGFRSTMTLASFDTTMAQSLRPPTHAGTTLVPAATSITIHVRIWVDGHGHLVRLTATEPLFTAMYRGGASATGFQIPATTKSPGPGAAPQVEGITRLSATDNETFTLTLSHFGVRVRVAAPPPPRLVAPGI